MAGAHTVFAVTSGVALLEAKTPSTYHEAMASCESAQWRAAMASEFDGCVAQETWVLVKRSDLPRGTNIIPVKWVFKIKTDEKGVVTKYKARITPKGFKQRHGVDYFEVFANTGKYKTLRVALSLAARRDLELRQLDVPQAFIQAALEEDVYMEMPQGFELDGMVCHLKKSLYGLKQSPRNWYLLISAFITGELGFRATASDPCLFWKISRTGQQILLFLFVDDMQVAFRKEDEQEWEAAHMQLKRRFNITNLGESKFMLGMRITRDRPARTIQLDQELYITKALEKFGLDQCKTAPTPAAQASSKGSPLEDREGANSQPTDLKLYQEKVGTLLYAAISTRPDIAFAVNKLAQCMQAPTVAQAKACDRVLRYLAGTKSTGLLFGRNSDAKDISVSAYADADWGSDHTDRKSITGWVTMVNGDPVSWASKKQKVVSQSSCEAELYSEAAAINEIKWLRGLLGEIHMSAADDPAPILYGDNQSTQELTRSGIKSERTKHIDIKYHFVTDEVSSGKVRLQWIPTTQQLADVLTKALGTLQHRVLCGKLMANTQAKEVILSQDSNRMQQVQFMASRQ
jgi:Reverse transcriptase (RNA-dependent DNA polymerase)